MRKSSTKRGAHGHLSLRLGAQRASINFNSIAKYVTPVLLRSIKALMKWSVRSRALGTVNVHFDELRCLLRYGSSQANKPIRQVTAALLESYYSSVTKNSLARRMGRLRVLIGAWEVLSLPGLESDGSEFLRSLTLPYSSKDVAMRTADPNAGPFTDLEFNALADAISRLDEKDLSDKWHKLVILVDIVFGLRPAQLALLHVEDVQRREFDGHWRYFLQIPQVKQKYQPLRTEFRLRAIPADLGPRLWAYANEVRTAFSSTGSEAIPLFPARADVESSGARRARYSVAADLSQSVLKVLDRLKVRSPQTGEELRIFMYRFRRTFASRAAAEGWTAAAIAEVLGHNSIRTVLRYIRESPSLGQRIDAATTRELAPLAAAFVGRLIPNESAATRCGDASSRITDPFNKNVAGAIGSCAESGACDRRVPTACYRCERFEPWLDAPHEELLQHLLEERRSLERSATKRVAAVNDLEILAVQSVVDLCRARRNKTVGEK